MFHYLQAAWVLLIVFFAAGCGNHGAESEEKVLRLWHIMNYSGPHEVLEAAVRRFEAAHPGVRVEVDVFSNDDYKTKLALEMSSGNEPDVFFTWGAGGQTGRYIEQGKVRALDELGKAHGWPERFLGSARALCSRDGALYGVPLDLSAVVLWCNRTLFERHNVPLPETWEDWLSACRTFRKAGVTPICLGNRDAWPGAFYYCYAAARLGGMQPFARALAGNSAAFRDPSYIRAGEVVQTLVSEGAFNPDYAERTEDEARKLFVRGKAAMYLGGSWLAGQILKDPDATLFLPRLTPLPFPKFRDAAPDGAAALLGGVNCAFALSSSCRHPELAAELMATLTDDETARAWCAIGRIPAVPVAMADLSPFPEPIRPVLPLLQQAPAIQPYYDQALPAAWTVAHLHTTRDLFAGRLSPAAAAAAMTRAAEKRNTP